MLTDPIADFLTRIRNGCRAHKERVDVPYSRLKEQIARVMVEQGYLRDAAVVGEGVGRSLRVYVGASSAPRIRQGLGVSILSTPAGVLPDREARERNVGGEVLCSVW